MKQIDWNIEREFSTEIDKRNFEDLIVNSLKIFNVKDFLLEINIVSNTKIQALNLQYREIDKPTDVLSFPQIRLAKQKSLFLGSLVISPIMVDEKAETMEDVINHGLLHLLGYDHETDEQSWQEAAKSINCNL